MRQTFDETAHPGFGHSHLPLLRQALAELGLDGFIVPHEDEHQNEYLPPANERLAWISGFTGSAGAAVVLSERAALFVDGRYTLQARDQVSGELFEFHDLMDSGLTGWLETELRPDQKIGYDPRLHSPDSLQRLKTAVEKTGAVLTPCADNPLDSAWGARPAQPAAPVVPHSLDHAGQGSHAKRAAIAAKLGADAALITAPASIAWLFNIRGGDVIRSPLPLGQAILKADGSARLFLDPAKWTPPLREWLGNEVSLEPTEGLASAIAALKGRSVLVDPAVSSAWYFDALEGAGADVVRRPDPCIAPRAAKNTTEIAGAVAAHRRDGVAMAAFLHWLATEAQESLPDELEVVTRLEACREATGQLQDLSFDTIAGFGPNGAVVHYHPTRRTALRLAPGSLLLVDSGAQYLDGTTDITRTVAIGTPSQAMRERFTRVLKGHLALSRISFPPGTTGSALDVLARAPLWEAGLDFDHGTGHGVGSYLGVHEGPQGISKRPGGAALVPGMIVSNEPGYYKTGEYGIRIENLVAVREAAKIPGAEKSLLEFETITLAPIDLNMVESSLLTDAEKKWLNAYHARVRDVISPLVDATTKAWLETATAAI
ncbi:MAG: metallopeptidase family protein [Caulobacteraceae bacterium]|nr:metallopeptidase family protein [Caulobacteraceae bacterium]